MENNNKKNIKRRDFFKLLGGAAALSAGLNYACKNNNNKSVAGGNLKPADIPADKMTYRINPSTGDKVSLLAYGCMRWPLKPTPDGKGQEIDQEAVNQLIDYAIEHGVNYFDTAPRYVMGLSEKATGIALKRHPRDKVFVATKLSNFAGNPYTTSRKGTLEIYYNSFKNLQVDYIDYYLLHATGIGGMKAIKERYFDNGVLDFLLKEREAGRIRNLGWSFHGDIAVYDYLLSLDIKWDFVMIQINYVDWEQTERLDINAQYLYNELVKRNIPVMVMEPLLGGRLAKLNNYQMAHLKQQRPNDSVASWAFRFAGSLPSVLTVLSGMTYMEHLQDNIRTYSPLEPLSEHEQQILKDVAQMFLKFPTIPCTDCKYCMPCPYGIDIPAVFTHYNRCLNEGNVAKSSLDENYKQARRAFLIGYDRSVPKLRQASHCIGCNICKPHCPQTIDIPAQMRRIDNFVEQLKQGIEF